MRIKLDKEYLPSEIAKYGFLISNRKTPYTQYSIAKLIRYGKLKANCIQINSKTKIYRVLGADIIEYKKNHPIEKRKKK